MTVTEQRPEADAEQTADEAESLYESPGFAGALATGDHKVLGRMYLLFGLAGGLLALVLNLLVALERIDIGGLDILTFGSNNQYFQTWSLGRTSLLFFCVMPLLLGLATYVVPLQVGAPSIAFPRAAAAAFWTWLVGMGIHVATVFVDGGLGYPVLPEGFTAVQGPDPEATELSLLSIGMVGIAILLASVCIVSTVIAQRPQGMTLYDVPLFSWSMLVAGGVWLLALPVWLATWHWRGSISAARTRCSTATSPRSGTRSTGCSRSRRFSCSQSRCSASSARSFPLLPASVSASIRSNKARSLRLVCSPSELGPSHISTQGVPPAAVRRHEPARDRADLGVYRRARRHLDEGQARVLIPIRLVPAGARCAACGGGRGSTARFGRSHWSRS